MATPRCPCSILSSLEVWERLKDGSPEISETTRETLKKNPENPCRTYTAFLLPVLTWQNYSANRAIQFFPHRTLNRFVAQKFFTSMQSQSSIHSRYHSHEGLWWKDEAQITLEGIISMCWLDRWRE